MALYLDSGITTERLRVQRQFCGDLLLLIRGGSILFNEGENPECPVT